MKLAPDLSVRCFMASRMEKTESCGSSKLLCLSTNGLDSLDLTIPGCNATTRTFIFLRCNSIAAVCSNIFKIILRRKAIHSLLSRWLWKIEPHMKRFKNRTGLLEPVAISLIRLEFKQESSSLWRKRVRVHESKPHLDLNFVVSH